MAKKYIKRCLIPLVIQEMKINITMGCNFTPNKMAKIKGDMEYQFQTIVCHNWNLSRDCKMVQPL